MIVTQDAEIVALAGTLCERFGLHDTGIGANDLLQIWRKGVFQSEEDFITSLEHIAFYLGTSEAKTLTHRKAWVTSQLAKGFYPAPVGFKSCEELQQEARLSAKRERLALDGRTRRRRETTSPGGNAFCRATQLKARAHDST